MKELVIGAICIALLVALGYMAGVQDKTVSPVQALIECNKNADDIEVLKGCFEANSCIIDYKDFARIAHKYAECKGK